MPDVTGSMMIWIEINLPRSYAIPGRIVEFEPYSSCVTAKNGKINAVANLMGAPWKGAP